MRWFLSLLFLSAVACASTPAKKESPDEPPPETGQQQPSARPPNRLAGAGGKRELDEAKKLAQDGNLDGAIAKSKEAIAKNPNMEEAYLLLGSACAMKDDAACEKDAYERGTSALPNSAALLNEKGLLELRTGDAKTAVSTLEKANQLAQKKDAKMMADLAYAYIFVDRLDEGAKLAKSARELDPKSIEAASSHGEVLLRKKDGAGASEAFVAAIALSNDAEVKSNLVRQQAIAEAIAGKHDKAFELLKSLVGDAPDKVPMIHAKLAAWLLELDVAKEAVTEAEKAAKLAPKDRRFLDLLMKAQEKAGDKKGATATKKKLDALGDK